MARDAYNRYVLGTLTLVYTFNYLDRGLIGLLLQPIKENLHLSDTQLGVLTGIAFGIFYATLGLPIARWADRGDRVTITSIAIGLWGIAVMSCVWVTNFPQLLGARIAAAVGESGCMPPTYSLVGDYFPEAGQRTRAMSIYMLASPLAALISFMAGGLLNRHFGWRVTFFLMGLPAPLIAVLVKLTISEPRRHAYPGHVRKPDLPQMIEVLAILWRQRSSRHLGLGIILVFFMAQGLGPWYAAFMMRSHGMGTAELGIWLGLIFGLGGLAGILFGGYVAGHWLERNERGQMRLNAAMVALLMPGFVLFLLLPQRQAALIALAPLMVVFSFSLGSVFALLQRLVVDEMRATTLALVMLLANLIGMGIGPFTVGYLSDLLRPRFGLDALRYAMLTMSLVALWAAYHYWQVGRTVNADLAQVGRRIRSNPNLPVGPAIANADGAAQAAGSTGNPRAP